eukprot:CAMPEP_0119570376 /NCGR_PEP_ID=MMETSP1352-20130426/43582_1 /TAXON_ID=265584 /ORGANISM="Stauroneis constricta, Strain CCMP1120" /LENGTH=681 /DNA_ID=CAMNT_0007620043 /DNA_START=165 /DNA_END=2210 /DNA_ORIENTATION=-
MNLRLLSASMLFVLISLGHANGVASATTQLRGQRDARGLEAVQPKKATTGLEKWVQDVARTNTHRALGTGTDAGTVAGISSTKYTGHRKLMNATAALNDEDDFLPLGIWISRGYGYVVIVTDDGVDAIQTTNVSCISSEYTSSFLEDIEDFEMLDETTLIADTGTTFYVFDKSEALPASCVYTVIVTDDGVDAIQTTDVSCISSEYTSSFLEDIEDFGMLDETTLVADTGTTLYVFDKSEALPASCVSPGGLTPIVGSPDYVPDDLRTLDILAQSFREHYAFFQERDIDWEDLVGTAREYLENGANDASLEDVVMELLSATQDIHVSVEFLGGETHYAKMFPAFEKLALEWTSQPQISDSEGAAAAPSADAYISQQLGAWLLIVESYLDDNLLRGDNDALYWGKFRHANVGYICFLNMDPDDGAATEAELVNAMSTLHDADSIIFDVRINSGGSDEVSLFLTSLFASEEFGAYSKQAVIPNTSTASTPPTFTEPYSITVEPSDNPDLAFSGKVVVLASESTVSAGEVFALAMKNLPQVTLMGHNTQGAFSDMLDRQLDNGWIVTLSNELYRDPEGVAHEVVGLPPHIPIEAELLPLGERQNGEDSWIVAALEELEAPLPTMSPTDGATGTPTPAPTNDVSTDAPTTAPTSAASDIMHSSFSIKHFVGIMGCGTVLMIHALA